MTTTTQTPSLTLNDVAEVVFDKDSYPDKSRVEEVSGTTLSDEDYQDVITEMQWKLLNRLNELMDDDELIQEVVEELELQTFVCDTCGQNEVDQVGAICWECEESTKQTEEESQQ